MQERNAWRRKELTIPILAVSEISGDRIHLTITKQQVQEPPPLNLDRSRHHASLPQDALSRVLPAGRVERVA
jgi:hypothetical protein